MTTNKREAVWNKFFTEGVSRGDICRELGLTNYTVNTYINEGRRQGMVPVKPTRKSRAYRDRKPLSLTHRAVGLQLSEHRTMVLRVPHKDFAEVVGCSRQVLSAMEQGIHDFTLVELIKISSIIGKSLENLLTKNIQLKAS